MKRGSKDFFGEKRFTVRRASKKMRSVAAAHLRLAYLRARNLYSSSPVTGEGKAVVSLTSHGVRLWRVHLVLEAIAAGSIRPARLVLWLDPEGAKRRYSAGLQRLIARGVEVKVAARNYGPHTKYFPMVTHDLFFKQNPDLNLVTADDDILYPRRWLAELLEASNRENTIVCHRAHRMRFESEHIAPYHRWGKVSDTNGSLCNFATGVMGVLYPHTFAMDLAREGESFMSVSPRADDVWLHVMAVRSGLKVVQVRARQAEFQMMPGSQAESLVSSNAFNGGNDDQVRATYQPQDVSALLDADAGARGA